MILEPKLMTLSEYDDSNQTSNQKQIERTDISDDFFRRCKFLTILL